MSKEIILYSPIHLEKWDHTTIDTTGIGGSETCHVLLAEEFAKAGYEVTSIAPCKNEYVDKSGVAWFPLEYVDATLKESNKQIWLVFRDPSFFDKIKRKKKTQKYYFIAQDVDYQWTEERLEKVDKYICLCQEHARYTLNKYPSLKDKVYVSTNGIRSDLIRKKIKDFKGERIPKRLIYSSSPDRGLQLILENWFRVLERHPDAKLEVFYGFDNLLKIAQGSNNLQLLAIYKIITDLAEKYKDSVSLNGRIPQTQLYEEMLKSSVWFYPSDWPETSCITSMEMQACGVYPIVNKYWAVGENVFDGVVVPGIPQKDKLCKAAMIKELINVLDNDDYWKKCKDNAIVGYNWGWPKRREMSNDALDTFDWKKVSKQYIKWFEGEK